MKAISVCISAYEMGGKGPGFLRFSLDKLARQTFKDFDVVVSDQSRDDGIEKACGEYAGRLDIHYFRERPEASPSENTNNAIRHATGKLIKILFLDDFLYADTSLEDIVKNFNLIKDGWLLTACIHTKDGTGFYRPFYPRYQDATILFKNTVSAPSVATMLNDSPVLFDDKLVWWQDLDFYKRCYERWGQPKILNEIGTAIRVHDSQMGNSSALKRREGEFRYVLEKYRIPGSARLLIMYRARRHWQRLKDAVKGLIGKKAAASYLSLKKKALSLVITAYDRIAFYPLVVRFGTTDAAVLEHVLINKEYDIDYGTLRPRLIIDAGANVGYASVFFARKFPDADIYAIEPEASNFKALQKNASPYPHIRPIKKGLWNTPGKLAVVDQGQGEWAFMTAEAKLDDADAVEAITIPDILEMSKLDRIDILKIDIEGAEKELFSGDCSWLDAVDMLIIELHDRMKEGSSKAFDSATERYAFKRELRGENVILRK